MFKNLPKSKRSRLFLHFRKTIIRENMGTHHEGSILSMLILMVLANSFVESHVKTGNQVEIRLNMNLGIRKVIFILISN